jgi:NADPH-dependent 2,4-dienoyl-CoA reductase/sulfur reductase-like enzyme
VIVTGRIVTPAQAEEVLRSGAADLVGMTRALIADPEMPRKAREGRLDDIRICMGSAEGCIDRLYFGMPIGCVQNPVIGREREWGTVIPAAAARRVLVVGGGPAGMEAARVLTERGHRVTILERDDHLGGALRIAARAPGWEAYATAVDWLARQLTRLKVEVQLGVTATATRVLAERPDAVVVATGAEPRRPRLPGVDRPHVVSATEVLAGTAPVRGRSVILDETSYTPGPKVADALSQAGHAVEIVTRQYSLGEDIGTTLRAKLLERLLRQGVTITVLAAPVAIEADHVRVRHMLTDAEWTIPADTVVLASGGQARDQLYHELSALTTGQESPPALHLIGDAYAPRNLLLAMVDAARVGRAI